MSHTALAKYSEWQGRLIIQIITFIYFLPLFYFYDIKCCDERIDCEMPVDNINVSSPIICSKLNVCTRASWSLIFAYRPSPGLAMCLAKACSRCCVAQVEYNTASLPRTFDLEIQFPSRGSRDISRPFPSRPSSSLLVASAAATALPSPLYFFLFFVSSTIAIHSLFRGSYLTRET